MHMRSSFIAAPFQKCKKSHYFNPHCRSAQPLPHNTAHLSDAIAGFDMTLLNFVVFVNLQRVQLG
jgi:hypothetical protein